MIPRIVIALVFFGLGALTTMVRFLAGAIYSSRTIPPEWAQAEFAWPIYLGFIFLALGMIYLVRAELEERAANTDEVEVAEPAPSPQPNPRRSRAQSKT